LFAPAALATTAPSMIAKTLAPDAIRGGQRFSAKFMLR
jgi:hypothetical protein